LGLDWPGYFRGLKATDARALAAWLAAQGLQVGEFMEVVDHVYAIWGRHWPAQPDAFIGLVGTQTATSYASRKRQFSRLAAMLEEAMATGALPGEVAPQELDLPVKLWIEPRSEAELLESFDRLGQGRG
jgi:hypothetical protein